jgi:hypothetical protein
MRRIFLILVILSSCTLGVDGDETIRAREAAGMLSKAAFSVFLRCRDEESTNVWLTPQSTCIKASDPDLLVRRSDVLGCVDRTAVLPCMDSAFVSDIIATNFAMNCSIETVPFLINDVSHPLQGNLLTDLTSSQSKFYYGCY